MIKLYYFISILIVAIMLLTSLCSCVSNDEKNPPNNAATTDSSVFDLSTTIDYKQIVLIEYTTIDYMGGAEYRKKLDFLGLD